MCQMPTIQNQPRLHDKVFTFRTNRIISAFCNPIDEEKLAELEPCCQYISVILGKDEAGKKGDYNTKISNLIYDHLRPPDKSNPDWNIHWLRYERGAEIHICPEMHNITDFLDETIGLPLNKHLKPFEIKRFARKLITLFVDLLPVFEKVLKEDGDYLKNPKGQI